MDEVAPTDTVGIWLLSEPEIIIVGSTRPSKKIQQRERIFSKNGIMGTLTASDYKDPPKVLI